MYRCRKCDSTDLIITLQKGVCIFQVDKEDDFEFELGLGLEEKDLNLDDTLCCSCDSEEVPRWYDEEEYWNAQ